MTNQIRLNQNHRERRWTPVVHAGRNGTHSINIAIVQMVILLQKWNRNAEAGHRPKAIYDWFTEGHDSLDLRDVRELLQELN